MPKMTASERTELKKAIEAFYKKVGRTWGDRPVNYCVAENFAIMIHEALKATDSLAWLPAPSMKPNLRWLLFLLARGLTEEVRNNMTPFAINMVLRNWANRLAQSSTLCAK